MSSLEVGIQFHLPTGNQYTVPALVDLAAFAHRAGFHQVWVTDNLRRRNAFVVLTAVAAAVPVRLGTAVMVQYFRNPVDLAGTLAAISELMDGREFSLGIGAGNPTHTPHQVRTVKPVGTLREMASCLQRLLDGEEIRFREYPLLAAYFQLNPQAEFRLAFSPRSPVRLFCGANGPRSLTVAGHLMDGVIFGPSFNCAVRTGRVGGLLRLADDAAAGAGRPPLTKVAEVNLSISADRWAARAFPRAFAASMMASLRGHGYTDDEIARWGVDPRDVTRLEQAYARGMSYEDAATLVTEPMVDATVAAGDAGDCREILAGLFRAARAHGFEQVMFSKLGPDYREAITLLAEEVLPYVL